APQAAGLFDRGISQSGPCVSPSAYKTLNAALTTGDQFTATLGCSGAADVPACLRSKTPAQLIAAAPPPGVNSGATWSPVVDGVVMPQQPLDALRSGSFNQVPIIQATTADEMSVFTPQFLAGLPPTSPIAQGIIGALVGAQWLPQINQIYPPANYPTAFHYFVDVVTDSIYSCNAWRADLELSKYTPTYAYEVNDKNLPAPLSSPIPLGAYHGAEMLLMQQLPEAEFNQLTNAQKEMSNLMIEQFTQFARTGHPTALLTLIKNRSALWPRFNRYTQPFFNYDSMNIGLIRDFAEDHHCGFWNGVLFGNT
ncbi:MAG: carboxylesterase family protein, partial [Spongiibacteraceae bacterium]